jgi:hypothetical protein
VTSAARTAVVAWLITSTFYSYQYTLRSAPAVMMPQLSEAFSLTAMGVASMVGLFYYGYSPFSLIAGAAMDKLAGPLGIVFRNPQSIPCGVIAYTVIKEANPPSVSGTATGVVNFLNFTFSALLGPVFGWILASVSGGAARMSLEHYQTAFKPLMYGVVLAIVLTFLLKETGTAVRAAPAATT